VVEAIERFCQRLTAAEKPTVLVLDNASMHHSRLFQSKTAAWQEKGLYLFYLPKYAPHLNLAETFWRKAKYEWLKPADYVSLTDSSRKLQTFSRILEQNTQSISKSENVKPILHDYLLHVILLKCYL
jgi:transposase